MPLQPDACCAADICCGGAKKREALVRLLDEGGISHHDAEKAAETILATFDLAPKGWGVGELIRKVSAEAREHPYNP